MTSRLVVALALPLFVTAPHLKPTHVRWLSFDGYVRLPHPPTPCLPTLHPTTAWRQDPGNQPFQNLGHTGSLAQIAEAYAKYGQFGLLDVEGVWDAGAAAHNGLTEGWQSRLMAVLTPAREFIANGTVKGIVMGDEPCASGVPASAMEEAALFIKAQVGPQAFVYVNGKSLPASPGVHVHWTPRRSTSASSR